jgi:phosphoribosyl-ATP pyrophosphohydrolase/phosphoribosyl-AMP cyclohydrolase
MMNIDFNKNNDGLVPVIVQDANTKSVLMLGFMNVMAYQQTILTNKVTFYSRTKKRLWTKGEVSGNFLNLISAKIDCDIDALLLQVLPQGPTCHKGSDTCWGTSNVADFGFLSKLETTIADRKENSKESESYIASLSAKGINKIAQKVGEEAVEVVIEAKDDNAELFLDESADLLFHYLILLQAKGFVLKDVVDVLERRVK